MTFCPCFIIPCYNHGLTVVDVIKRLSGYGIPIFIVDDGSDDFTRHILEDIAYKEPWVRLFRLPVNQGKGAAVMRAMREAQKAHCSHAVQVDADGQHALEDIPRFLALAEKNPTAVICGQPVYDESVPKARLYGRYLTHVWVWIETLSFAIRDSMCGFRCYPLDSVCKLIPSMSSSTRMDFDIEILVRLYWDDVEMINVPTPVVYPANGVSHFKVFSDNVRITKMHCRLFFSMCFRMPELVGRHFRRDKTPINHWAKLSERGSLLGMQILFVLYRLLGASVVKMCLYPIVAYFFLTGTRARMASRQFLERVKRYQGRPSKVSYKDIYSHFYSFAESAVDKLGAWCGQLDRTVIEPESRKAFDDLIRSQQGILLVGAHLGNLEMCRALARQSGVKKVNAVVYSEHAVRFTELLKKSHPDFAVNLIYVQEIGIETAVVLKNKIEQGEWVVIVGDRTPVEGNKRTERVDFLGEPAPFAHGPWILASLLECPVYLFFCIKQNRSYQVALELFSECIELPRRERQARLRSVIVRYAERLAYYACRSPLQWFNFYDFWQADVTRLKDGTKEVFANE